MNQYEELLAKYEYLKVCRNNLLEIVKTVQPNGFLQKTIRQAEALQKIEKEERVPLQYQKFAERLLWELTND